MSKIQVLNRIETNSWKVICNDLLQLEWLLINLVDGNTTVLHLLIALEWHVLLLEEKNDSNFWIKKRLFHWLKIVICENYEAGKMCHWYHFITCTLHPNFLFSWEWIFPFDVAAKSIASKPSYWPTICG